jgi:Type II intron maturase
VKQQKKNVFKTDLVRTDLNFITLFYVRYIDDFLFGVAGPKSLVLLIKKRVVQFVKSDLKLELVGGEVTHVSSGKVSFLGIKICRVSCAGLSQRFCNALEKRKRVAFKSLVQRKVKEGKNLKVLQLRLKKLVEKSVFYDVKGLFNLKFKFQGIKKGVLFNNKFICPDITLYKKFIKRFYLSQAFVPDSLIRMLRMFENELTCWKKAYQRINLNIFARKRKKLTVKQTLRTLSLYAPMQELKEKLKLNGLLTKFNRPAAVNRMLNQKNHIIVGWFHSIAQGFLEYYRCCHNFVKVKNYVEYFVRWSAIHTLAKKHSSSCSNIVSKWSKNLVVLNLKSDKLVDFPGSSFIKTMGRKFLSGIHLNMGLLVLNSIWLKFSSLRWFALKCSFKSCSDVSAIEMYPINNLSQIKNSFGFSSVAMGKSELLKNGEAFTIVSTSNKIPFCKNHYKYLCTKKINLFALDWDYLKNFE